MEVTSDLYNLILFAKMVVLHRHIRFNLAIAAIAEAILMQTSAEQVPFLHGVATWYLKKKRHDGNTAKDLHAYVFNSLDESSFNHL